MANMILPNNFEIRAEYIGDITDNLKTDFDNIAAKHVDNMSASYLKKYIDKADAEVHFHIRIEKSGDGRFECKFHVAYDWQTFDRHTGSPFKEPYDALNHGFKHFKEHLAQK